MQPPDDRHLELLGAITGAKTEGRLGGPVLAIWTFRAKEPGTMGKDALLPELGMGRESGGNKNLTL